MKNLILIKITILTIINFLFASPQSSTAEIYVNTQLLLSSGQRVVAGYVASVDGGKRLALARYQKNGKLDKTFELEQQRQHSSAHSEQIFQLLELANGNLLAVGQARAANSSTSCLFQCQLSCKGKIIKKSTMPLKGSTMAVPQKLASFGSGYLIAGLCRAEGGLQQFLLALQPNGKRNKDFGINGLVYIHTPSKIKDLAIQHHQKILLLGSKLYQLNRKGQVLQQYTPNFQTSCLAVVQDGFYLGGQELGAFILQKMDANLKATATLQKYYFHDQEAVMLKSIAIDRRANLNLGGVVERSVYDHDSDWIIVQLEKTTATNLSSQPSKVYHIDLSQNDDELESLFVYKSAIYVMGFEDVLGKKRASVRMIPSNIPKAQ